MINVHDAASAAAAASTDAEEATAVARRRRGGQRFSLTSPVVSARETAETALVAA